MSCHVLFNQQPQHWPVCRVVNMHLGVSICSFFHLLVWDFSHSSNKNFPQIPFKKKYKNANLVPKTFKKLGQQKVVFWTNRHPWLGLGWPDLHQFNAPTSNVYKGSVPTPNVCNITSNICKCSTNVTSNVYIFKCCRWPFSSAVQYQLQCL